VDNTRATLRGQGRRTSEERMKCNLLRCEVVLHVDDVTCSQLATSQTRCVRPSCSATAKDAMGGEVSHWSSLRGRARVSGRIGAIKRATRARKRGAAACAWA